MPPALEFGAKLKDIDEILKKLREEIKTNRGIHGNRQDQGAS